MKKAAIFAAAAALALSLTACGGDKTSDTTGGDDQQQTDGANTPDESGDGLTISVAASPNMTNFIRARVIATFILRKSFRNPICPSSLARTRLIKITSRSCP